MSERALTQHWREQATASLNELTEMLHGCPEAAVPARMAIFGQKAKTVLELALSESEQEAIVRAWSEGVRFALLEANRQDDLIPVRAIPILANRIVAAAMKVRRDSMNLSTDALRLMAAVEQALEILDDAGEEVAAKVLQNALDEVHQSTT